MTTGAFVAFLKGPAGKVKMQSAPSLEDPEILTAAQQVQG